MDNSQIENTVIDIRKRSGAVTALIELTYTRRHYG